MSHTQARRDADRAAIQPILVLLAKRWPRCFKLESRRRKPLAVGIRAEIEQQLPEIDPRLLRRALSFYVASMGYQRASMVAGAVRVALDGNASGMVTAEQANKAILKVAALAEKQQSRLAAKPIETEAAANKATGALEAKAVPVSKSLEPGAADNDRPRLGLRDLREAGRRRAGRP
jgi:sRNA-binding protein